MYNEYPPSRITRKFIQTILYSLSLFVLFSPYQPVSERSKLYSENLCERLKMYTRARVTAPPIIATAATCPDTVSHLRVATSPRGRPFVLTSVVLSSRPPRRACEPLQYTIFGRKINRGRVLVLTVLFRW